PLPRPLYALPAAHGPRLALPIASNGISYASVAYDVSGFAEEDWPWLDLYAELLPDLGAGERSYEAAGGWRQQLVSAFDVELESEERIAESAAGSVTAPALNVSIVFSAKNLHEEQATIAVVLAESIRRARFDERERVAFLIRSIAEGLVQELAEEGDQYASIAAESPFSIRRHFDDSVEGLRALQFYRTLRKQVESEQELQAICRKLDALHQRVISSPVHILAAGMGQDAQVLAEMIDVPGAVPAETNSAQHHPNDMQRRAEPANVALF